MVVEEHNQQVVPLEVQVQRQVLHSKEVMHLAHSIQAVAVAVTGAAAAATMVVLTEMQEVVVEALTQAA